MSSAARKSKIAHSSEAPMVESKDAQQNDKTPDGQAPTADLFDQIASKWDQSQADPFAHAEGGEAYPSPASNTTLLEAQAYSALRGEGDEGGQKIDEEVIGQLTGEAIAAADDAGSDAPANGMDENTPIAADEGIGRDELVALFETGQMPDTAQEPLAAEQIPEAAALGETQAMPVQEAEAPAAEEQGAGEQADILPEVPEETVRRISTVATVEMPSPVAPAPAAPAAAISARPPKEAGEGGGAAKVEYYADVPRRVAALASEARNLRQHGGEKRSASAWDPSSSLASKDAEIARLNAHIAELERQLMQAAGLLRQIEMSYLVGMRNKPVV
jgi:hypothetical protein